jgi:hypothetical protein
MKGTSFGGQGTPVEEGMKKYLRKLRATCLRG